MTITSYDGVTVELPAKFDAPANSFGEHLAKDFLPRFNASDIARYMNGAKIVFNKDENQRPLNWGTREFTLIPGDPTPYFDIWRQSDRSRPSITPI